jgi:hypothetical protein
MMTKNRIETMVTTLNACKQPSGRGTSADVPHNPPIKERKTARQIEALYLRLDASEWGLHGSEQRCRRGLRD